MIIAIPVDEKNENSNVCVSYGRTPFYMFYNTETKTLEFIDNEAANASGGAGIKASQMLVDKDVNVVLTIRCGQNAADVLNAANVEIYKTQAETARANIEAFKKGELEPLTDFHPGFHNHGN